MCDIFKMFNWMWNEMATLYNKRLGHVGKFIDQWFAFVWLNIQKQNCMVHNTPSSNMHEISRLYIYSSV